jgi:hypothetical protein
MYWSEYTTFSGNIVLSVILSCNKHGSKYYWNEQQHVVSIDKQQVSWFHH